MASATQTEPGEFQPVPGFYRVSNMVMVTIRDLERVSEVLDAFLQEVEARKVTDVLVAASSCAGLCSREPMATVELLGEAPVKYVDLDDAKTREILVEHVIGGKMVEKYALAVGSETTY